MLFTRPNISLLRSEEDLVEPSFYKHWVPTGPKPTTATKTPVVRDTRLERFFPQHGLHNPDLGALATVDVCREIK